MSVADEPSSKSAKLHASPLSCTLEELRAECLRLEAEIKKRDEFLAIAAHELRTPIQIIMSWTHMLQMGTLSSADMERGLKSIAQSVRFQAQFVDDLFEFSRIVSGQLQLNPQPLDVAHAVRSAVDGILPIAQSKQIELKFNLDCKNEVLIEGDTHRFNQILWNLMNNSIKFTPSGGCIELRLKELPSQVCIEIQDNGVGIPPEFLPLVFERYQQGAKEYRRDGLGLGLMIVKLLVESHRGEVCVRSEGEGKGATISLTLPLMRSPLNV